MHSTHNIVEEDLRKKEADNRNKENHNIEQERQKRSAKQPKEIRNSKKIMMHRVFSLCCCCPTSTLKALS